MPANLPPTLLVVRQQLADVARASGRSGPSGGDCSCRRRRSARGARGESSRRRRSARRGGSKCSAVGDQPKSATADDGRRPRPQHRQPRWADRGGRSASRERRANRAAPRTRRNAFRRRPCAASRADLSGRPARRSARSRIERGGSRGRTRFLECCLARRQRRRAHGARVAGRRPPGAVGRDGAHAGESCGSTERGAAVSVD